MRHSPGQAAVVTMLVPGLAHILAGRVARGLLAFVSTVGMFLVGYAIVGVHLWYYEILPPGGMFWFLRHIPVQLLPEFANTGCSIVAGILRPGDTNELLRVIRMPVEAGHFGTMLTGLSGIVAALWACDAYWIETGRTAPRVSPAVAAAATWFLPGSGHVLAGQKSKGKLVGAAVLLMFIIGLASSQGHAVDRYDHSFWWAGQAFCGIGVVFASLVTAPLHMKEFPEVLNGAINHDLGLILTTIAGLMNVMLMTDAYTVAAEGSVATSEREAVA